MKGVKSSQTEALAGCGKTQFMRNMPLDPSILVLMAQSPQEAQKGRPARPQRAKRRGVRFGTLSLRAMRERRWRTFSASC